MDINANEIISKIRSLVNDQLQTTKSDLLPESLITRSLIACNYDINKASQLISSLVKSKRENGNMFIKSYTDEDVQAAFGRNYSTINAKGPNGETIIINRVKNWDPSTQGCEFLYATMIFTFYCLFIDSEILKNGIIFIVDVSEMGWKHVKSCNPLTVKTFFQIISNELPSNFKYIANCNINWAAEMLYKATKAILPKSVTEKLILASNLEKLVDSIGHVDIESIRQWNESDVESFKSKIKANGDLVMKEWMAIDQMFQ